MPLFVPCARYSLVKGERIVRFALSTRLNDYHSTRGLVYIQFSCKYVGKEYGINHEVNSDWNFLAAGCFFAFWNAVAAAPT